ncbi:MAG TPA: DUF1295 domain-containing protein [Candidatus Limnocylindrales bacterium]|nr:DUF1295 domain-containing protein [Candidatus Limnocylindrales bacterium]
MKRATRLVLLAYVAALIVAIIVGRALFPAHPLLVALGADLAATLAIFAFSMAFDNSSFYDPYWSVAPLPMALYWGFSSTAAHANGARQDIVIILLMFWGVRLTYNWYRGWQGLGHEDWRYVDMRARSGRGYPAVSLLAIHLFPTLIVFAGLLPAYAAMTYPLPLGWIDGLGTAMAAGAIVIETMADEQLRRFRAGGAGDGSAILSHGLWRYSRHPNYFGENLFWWGLALLGIGAGAPWWWAIAGAVAITVMFVFVSVPLLDQRMRRRPGYEDHMKRVSALVPWFPR